MDPRRHHVTLLLPLGLALLVGCSEPMSPPMDGDGPRSALASQDWPDEPPGSQVLTDQPWDALGTDGWMFGTGDREVVSDPTAPFSPSNVLTFPFDSGFAGGGSPGEEWYPLNGAKRIYAGTWWKASDPWQGHSSNVNQLEAVKIDGQGQMYLTMYGPPGGPYELRVFAQFSTSVVSWLTPNIAAATLVPGTWHRIEWSIDYAQDPANGVVKWWLDGDLVGSYDDVPFPSQGLLGFGLTPAWGGAGDAKQSAGDYFRFDHTRVSTGGWPDQPAGLDPMTDYSFSDPVPVTEEDQAMGDQGWMVTFNSAGNVTRVSDATAPGSPSFVAQWRYPEGFHDGSAPGKLWFPHAPRREVFAGFWWKVSDPWQGHDSNVNKIAFWFPQNGGGIYLAMYGPPGGPYRLQVLPEFNGLPVVWRMANKDSTPVSLGTWHRVEWHMKYATTPVSGDGVVQWWLDGVLQGDHHDLQTPADLGFGQFEFSPTWGGNTQDVKTETDHIWVDHVLVSGVP